MASNFFSLFEHFAASAGCAGSASCAGSAGCVGLDASSLLALPAVLAHVAAAGATGHAGTTRGKANDMPAFGFLSGVQWREVGCTSPLPLIPLPTLC